MGIWEFISWSTDSVKGLWQSSCDHSSAAISKVDKAVRVHSVGKVNQLLSDPDTWSKISTVATELAKNATIEGIKAIPGASTIYRIFSKSLSDNKNIEKKNKLKKQKEELKTLQATVSRLEKEMGVMRKKAEVKKQAAYKKPQNTVQDHSLGLHNEDWFSFVA